MRIPAHHTSGAVSTSVVDLLTELAAAAALNAAVSVAVVAVIGQPLRWTLDGTTPSATVGRSAAAGSSIELVGLEQIRGFKAIREGGSDAEIETAWFAR